MIITREKGMRMWGGGSGSTSASGVNGGGGFSLAVEEGEGTGNAYTGFTYESGVLSLIKGEKFVTVDFFNRLFTAYDSDGNAILPNDVTSTINNLKLLVGTWTEEYLSALGKNSEGGGGGGGIELSDVWQSLKTNTDDYANQKINLAHIPDLSGTYATKTWVNQQGFVTSSGVTSVATGTGLTGGTITSTGTISINSTYQTYISNGNTAYGWGNHATAGYASASSVTTLQGYFTNGVAKTAAKLNTGTTTYTAWGQTYWSSGVPQSISGNMTSVGSITPSANGNALGTTSARFNIYGTAGNFSGNVSITGTLGVTGAATLSSSLSVASGITLTTTKKIYFGDTSHYIELNSTGFHFSHGIYSDSFVSALGANSSGGGSGTFDEEAMWTALGTTITAKKISNNYLNLASWAKASSKPSYTFSEIGSKPTTLSGYGVLDDANGRYYALNDGTALTATSSSHYDLNSLTTAGSYFCSSNAMAAYFDNMPSSTDYAFRIWVSLPAGTGSYRRQRFQYYSLQTIYERYYNGSDWGGWQIVQRDLSLYALASSLDDYLPLSGGTMSNTNLVTNLNADLLDGHHASYFAAASSLSNYVTLNTDQTITGVKTFRDSMDIKYPTDTSLVLGMYWLNTSGTVIASLLYHNTAKNLIFNPIGATDAWEDAVGKYSLIVGNNKLTYNTYTILHSNNTYVSSGKGYINGTEITTITGNAATATKATQDGNGDVISSTYLPLSGGALAGELSISTSSSLPLTLSRTAGAYYCGISFSNSIDGNIGNLGVSGSANTYNDDYPNLGTLRYSPSGASTAYAVMHNGLDKFITATASGRYAELQNSGWLIHHITVNDAFSVAYCTQDSSGNNIGGICGCYGKNQTITNYFIGGTWNAPLMRIVRSTGNVGIGLGNTNPSQKLHVAGSILTTANYFLADGVSGMCYTDSGKNIDVGWNWSNISGAGIGLRSSSHTNAGQFSIYARSSSANTNTLNGNATGSLTWSGSFTASGEVTASSDERKKNIISETKFNVKDIASTRSILYEWNDGRSRGTEKKVYGGSIAQDWLGIADSFLMQDEDGFYSINYGALALCSAITIAREVLKHSDEIDRLKQEVSYLKARVAELEERRA